MNEEEKKRAFVKEYEELCRKYGYCVRAEFYDLAVVDKLTDDYFEEEFSIE